MISFEDLQSQWDNQSKIEPSKDGFNKVLNKVRAIRKKQKITNVVLTTTILVLGYFFFYISGYKNSQVILGLALMIGSLVIRVVIEFYSIRKLKNINRLIDFGQFRKKMIQYYQERVKVHFIMTPIITGLYIIGFAILLPLFKASLSKGFYTYIIVSSIVVLLVLGTFITKQIRKELSELRLLKNME